MAIGRSEAGRKNRQNILDYMHKMGRPVSCREICMYLDQAQEQTRARLAVMREHKEVVMTSGLVGNYPTPLYAPLVATTTPVLLSTKTGPKDVEQHQQSPSERKRLILEWIRAAKKEVTITQIAAQMDVSRKTVQNYMRELRADGEVLVTNRVVTTYSGNQSHSTSTGFYSAAPINSERPKRRMKGHVHWGTHREHPLKNSGGQGALPMAFGIQSVMG